MTRGTSNALTGVRPSSAAARRAGGTGLLRQGRLAELPVSIRRGAAASLELGFTQVAAPALTAVAVGAPAGRTQA